MEICQEGFSRIVFLIGGYAVKIPRMNYGWRNFIRGLNDSLQEREVFRAVKNHEPEHLPLLCPILHSWLGGIITIMPRCETGLSEQDIQRQDTYKRIQDARLYGDDSAANYGRLNGQIVKLDYGHCTAIFD